MIRIGHWLSAAAGMLLIAASNPSGGVIDGARISAGRNTDWLTYGRTYDEQRFSPLTQINRDTVGRLGLAWWAQFDTDRGQEATPLVADGVIYTTTAWSKVYAHDARTGRLIWRYDPKTPGQAALSACCDVVNRGAALWQGRLFFGTLDGRLIALDAKTGALAWEVQTTDRTKPYTITGAPRVVKGKVLIGNGGADYGVRGYVSAYDAATGRMAWRFYTAPNPTGAPDGAPSDKVMRETVNATWFDGAWKEVGGGGTVWDAITYDEKNDLLLVGVGNASPWNREVRSGGKGDNLFLASIVALRPDTGEYVWHYQTAPGDSWDYTATQHIMLADLRIGGQQRRVVMQAPKNGFFYVLDAATGRLLSAEKYIPLDWAERVDLATGRPVMAENAFYPVGHPVSQLPGALGGHNWQPMAFSPKTGLVYIPAQQMKGYYSQPDAGAPFRYNPGFRNYAMGARADRPPTLVPTPSGSVDPTRFGELIAWDPVAGRPRWRLQFPQFWRSGVLATGGDLVFHVVGKALTAFDAEDGKVLWRYDIGIDAIAPPISYELDGEQYIALAAGAGGAGALTLDQVRRPGRLLVFKLGATARAPTFPPAPERPPLNLASAVPARGDAARAVGDYVQFCQPCHRNTNFLPNLSRSPAILRPEPLRAIVLGGALRNNGMPAFDQHLDEARLEGLRAFFLAEAAKDPAAGTAPAADVH